MKFSTPHSSDAKSFQSSGLSRRSLIIAGLAGSAAAAVASASPALASTSTAIAAPIGFTFQAENKKLGTPRNQLPSSWGVGGDLQGFIGQHASTAQQRVIDLYVGSTQKAFQVKAYRLGNYAGLGQRLVWTSAVTPNTIVQPPATVDPVTRTTSCSNWKVGLKIDTSTWPEGYYYLVLSCPAPWFSRTTAPQPHMIPLVVESASLVGKAVLVYNDLTMQAYNKWGGASLYTGGDGKIPTRALKVSFDRPYTNLAMFENDNAGLPRTAESITDSTVKLGYTTEARIAANPTLLAGAAAILFSGHSEYWSRGMRQNVEKARDSGTNVVFFGANNLYWRIRTEPTAIGADRLVVCYRETALDPMAASHPELATVRWQDAPSPEPACSLTGSMYGDLQCKGLFTVTEPKFFAFQGTGVVRGSTFPGIIQGEIDTAVGLPQQPRNLLVFSHSPTAGSYRAKDWSDGSVYTVGSGAAVVNMATTNWLACQYDPAVPVRSRNWAAQVTRNVIAGAAHGPLGQRYGWPAV